MTEQTQTLYHYRTHSILVTVYDQDISYLTFPGTDDRFPATPPAEFALYKQDTTGGSDRWIRCYSCGDTFRLFCLNNYELRHGETVVLRFSRRWGHDVVAEESMWWSAQRSNETNK